MFRFEIKDEYVTWYVQTVSKSLNEYSTVDKGLYDETVFTFWSVNNREGSKPKELGSFHFSPMPGCCGVVVSHNTFLNKDYHHSNVSNPFRKIKHELAKALGYTLMIATTQMENLPGVGNMIKAGYMMPKTFTNKRTGNLIGLGYKVLT